MQVVTGWWLVYVCLSLVDFYMFVGGYCIWVLRFAYFGYVVYSVDFVLWRLWLVTRVVVAWDC